MSTPGRRKEKLTAEVFKSNRSGEIRIKTKYGYLTLTINPNHPDLKIRVLIRKIVGNAVKRNYYKRVLRECMRNNRSKFSPYNDCTFYYQYKARARFTEIQNELNDKFSGLE
jgi:ribonuclease P protein component